MDLIYMSSSFVDIGVLQNYDLDYESNTEKGNNTFQIECALTGSPLSIGMYIYIDGTEYGGRIDEITIDTSNNKVQYSGRTYRGFLESKILEPVSGADYYTVSGDLNTILSEIFTKVSLTDLFEADNACGVTTSYQFNRYTDVHAGLLKMVDSLGMKLEMEWDHDDHKIKAGFVPIVDYSSEGEIGSDRFDFKIQKTKGTTNHMIGLGQGDLKDRQVVHRYIDANGSISSTQYYTGADEVVDVYDNSSAESLADLTQGTEDELAAASVEDSLEITSNGDLDADIGDKFTAYDFTSGVSITQYVVKKIVKISDTDISYEYEVGGSIL